MKLIISIFLLFIANIGLTQTSGAIFYSPTAPGATAVLDPNSDIYVSGNGGFSATVTTGTADESTESEIQYSPMYSMETEPTGDLQTGSTCGVSEIIDNPNDTGKAGYFYYHDPDAIPDNGDEHLLFRMRIANVGAGAYGYSILLDTDTKIGAADPNNVNGNPGFEIEILFGSGNSGEVIVYDVDGESAPNQFTTLASYPNNSASRYQKSYISNTNCPGATDPMFIDFYIDYATIMPYVTGPIRMAFATSSSASTALGGSASDIGGVDDGNITDDDSGFIAVIESFPNNDFFFSSGTILGENELNLNIECLEANSSQQNRVLIEWVDDELNNSTYTIEKSEDGINWAGVYTVDSTNNESGNRLNYLDNNSTEKLSYYRLIKLSLNGNKAISKIYSSFCEKADVSLKIFPNPVENLLHVFPESELVGEQTVELIDCYGRVVKVQTIQSGELNIIDVSNLVAGSYSLVLTDKSGIKKHEMFIKR